MSSSPAGSLALRAEASREAGDLPQAATLYEQALAEDPSWTQGWWYLGNVEYQQDRYAAARDALGRFIGASPRAVAALALRGLCQFELGDNQPALDDIQQALALGAANQARNAKILLYHEALLLTRLGRFQEAIAKLSEFATSQHEVNDDVATALGLAGLHISTPPAGIAPAQLDLVLRGGRAGLQIVTGETAAGLAAFHQLELDAPTQLGLHYFAGYLLLNSDPDAAVEQFREEASANPASQPTHTMLAWSLEMLGRYTEALPIAQLSVQEEPNLSTNQLVLGRALLETGDIQAAQPHIERVIALEPRNLEAHMSLAKIDSELGRKEEAYQQRMLCLQLQHTEGPHAH